MQLHKTILSQNVRKENLGQTSNTLPYFIDPCLQKVAVKLLDYDRNCRTDNYNYILCPLSSLFKNHYSTELGSVSFVQWTE